MWHMLRKSLEEGYIPRNDNPFQAGKSCNLPNVEIYIPIPGNL